jgi:GNAT superfamily N-acetyltransferase
MAIEIKNKDNEYFEAYDNVRKIGSLDIFTDDEGLNWLNGIEVNLAYRRKGVATMLIEKAIDELDDVYISTASQTQHNDNNDNTARYLCDDGASLVNKLIERKVIKKKWMKNPFS